MMASERRFDIDWLRVIAIGLLVIYHIAISFQPWGVFIGFIQNSDSLELIWIPMSMLNVWRIPILFFISGMGVFFALQGRDWKSLLLERTRRILVPFIFGVLAIVPLHLSLWQYYYNQDFAYSPNPAHLWFLGNIFVYILILLPLFVYLKTNPKGKFSQVIDWVMSRPIGLLVIMIPFVLEVELVKPEPFELYAMTAHGFWIGLVAFFTGFCCVFKGDQFWQILKRGKWLLLTLAATLFFIRFMEFNMVSPGYLIAIESNLWIFTVFGFGYAYLNRPSKILSYLSQASYPVYIIHMVFLYLGSILFFGFNIPAVVKFMMLNVFTFGGCLLTYEFVIRRSKYMRTLFGLKP